MLELKLDEVKDEAAREALQAISEAWSEVLLLSGQMRLLDLTLETVTAKNFSHGLKNKPLDVIITHDSGGTLTVNSTTKEFINLTTSGPTRVRILIGTFLGSR